MDSIYVGDFVVEPALDQASAFMEAVVGDLDSLALGRHLPESHAARADGRLDDRSSVAGVA